MSDGIPVMIHLTPETFAVLERAAAKRGQTMRQMIVQYIEIGVMRSIPKPPRSPANRLTARQIELIPEMIRQGMTAGKIAQRFGCSPQAIRARLRRMEQS